MSYLQPPPMPAPVVVVKDVGGYVTDYETQTAIYRMSGREVRLHECRSACTLALSLPNVCVYQDSILKFHLAYDPRNHQANPQVSQQMFSTYPTSVQARLGTLTRDYKVLRGSELIALGVRDCDAPKTDQPKILVASAAAEKPTHGTEPTAQTPLFAGMFDKMLSVIGLGGVAQATPSRAGSLPRQGPKPMLAEIPLPPARPPEFVQTSAPDVSPAASLASFEPTRESAVELPAEALRAGPAQAALTELPPPRPREAAVPPGKPNAGHALAKPRLPAIISGAQPILPPHFHAYAELDR